MRIHTVLPLVAFFLPTQRHSVMSLMLRSPAAERNKHHIAEILHKMTQQSRQVIQGNRLMNVFEIASGTGEHAACFLSLISDILYQPSDPSLEVQDSIVAWTHDYQERVNRPLIFDITTYANQQLPPNMQDGIDIVVCINMIHISHWDATLALFEFAKRKCNKQGKVLTYGPYRVNGIMSESNEAFDASLKSRNPEWGVRDKEAVVEVARSCGFALDEAIAMPANNMCLLFSRHDS